jgi:DNA-binding protein H-NS
VLFSVLGALMKPKEPSLTTLSNEALCKLRDEITELLNSRAEALRREFNRLTGGGLAIVGGNAHGGRKRRESTRKKVAPKYRGPDGETWTGRGMHPRWLTKAISEGKQISDFLIDNEFKKAEPVKQIQRLRKVHTAARLVSH